MNQKFKFFLLIFKLFIFIFFFNSSVLAINVGQVEIDYPYGRETSDNEACALAELKLQDKARQKAGGEESISAESFKVCKGSENENQCNYYTNSFHSIGAYQIVNYEPIKTDGEFCIFSDGNKDIKIVSRKGNFIIQKLPDQSSNFDFRITLSNNEFVSHPLNTSKDLLKKNESLKINIQTYEDMYISIFQWLPFQDINNVQKIFPNNYDKDNFFKSNLNYLIPSSDSFRFRIDFPNEEEIFESDIQEFLMFIGTKEQIDFFDQYDFSEFGSKLFAIKNLRQHQKSYIIHKRQNN